MSEKTLHSRIIHKHDTEAKWSQNTTFVPKQGEIVIYDKDDNHSYERIKIGDGTTTVNLLPFINDNVVEEVTTKKEKDLIVTYANGSHYLITHSVAEINEAVNNGRTVMFQKDAEFLDLLELTADYATFYIVYVNMNNKIQQKVVAVQDDSILLEQDDTYDFAQKSDVTNSLKNYFTKTETQNAIAAAIDAIEIPETVATKEYVENLYKKLNSNTVLGFYCIEDVTISINGISKVYPANTNVEVSFIEDDVFEIIPTSNNSILSLTAYPGALSTYYSWLEGVKQFSNILFDMNSEEMYTKWNQGNQGAYQVQYAQYTNCIFWSDNPYISELSKRTNYTLYYSSQLPLCYSNIPENTFKAFYLAFNVNSDPNWGNKTYRDSFAQANYATQVFSYYGARTIGIFGHDDPDFNIMLPPDCRGLMSAATAIENAGTFDAINVTNFGAKSGSWRDAFGWCGSLRNLYIKNLKVNLNVSWSPLEYDCISFIISEAANTNSITISVSPYTYNLLSQTDFDLATSKNINIELITTNYIEDKRLKAVGEKITNGATLANSEDISAVLEEAKSYADEAIENINISGAAQPDWEENDPESENYIKNRTHWIERSSAVALEETTIGIRNGYIDLMDVPMFEAFSDNATVKVTLNGVEYETTARLGTYNAYQWYTVGNGEIIGEGGGDLNVSFGFFIDRYEENWGQMEEEINGNITLKIEVVGDVIHKIPEIYLPEKIGAPGSGSYAEVFNNIGNNIASADYSHAENFETQAIGYSSHAEGIRAIAQGYASHAEGNDTHANAPYSHAEGWDTSTTGVASHASGIGTNASAEAQTVIGKYNATSKDYFIVGKGSSDSSRANAFTIGTTAVWSASPIYVGGTSSSSTEAQEVATKNYVDSVIEEIPLELIDTICNE